MRLPGVELTVRNGVKTVVNRTGNQLYYSFKGDSIFYRNFYRVNPRDFEPMVCDDFSQIDFMVFIPKGLLKPSQYLGGEHYLAAVKNVRRLTANFVREMDR